MDYGPIEDAIRRRGPVRGRGLPPSTVPEPAAHPIRRSPGTHLEPGSPTSPTPGRSCAPRPGRVRLARAAEGADPADEEPSGVVETLVPEGLSMRVRLLAIPLALASSGVL